jgi:hypothetical protein
LSGAAWSLPVSEGGITSSALSRKKFTLMTISLS